MAGAVAADAIDGDISIVLPVSATIHMYTNGHVSHKSIAIGTPKVVGNANGVTLTCAYAGL